MAEVLLPIVERRRNDPALIDERGTTSWAELNPRVNRLIHGLRDLGVGPGSVVAALLANSREYYELFAAAAHGGFLVVPVNWHWVPDELAYVLADADVRVLIADARFTDTALAGSAAHSLRAQISVGGSIDGFLDYEELLADADAAEPTDQFVGGPMFYTSGTTGRPKGVRNTMLGDGKVPAGLLSLLAGGFSASMGSPADGLTYLNGPLYHSAQWAFSVFPMLAGSGVVMRHRFDAAEALRIIDDHGVTNTHLVPTQFVRLLRVPDAERAAFRGDSLQIVWHGAAPCPIEVKRRMLEWWGPKITEYYGATEGGIVTLVNGEQWLQKPGTLGPPTATCELRIMSDDGERLGPNQPGTIYVKNLMGTDFSYHRDPEKTAKAHLEPGVFTMGDIGYVDDDGWLFMSDRKIDMIISGGVNIYPAEIEGALINHPAVRDAAVFGIPNEEFGEEVKAAIELDDGFADSDELRAQIIGFCREKLAGYKVPRSIDVVDALPRHPTGKLYKRLLRDPYWDGIGRSI